MEKKKSIVFKKITVSILSILFVVCAYVPFVPKVKALSNVITYNQYGSFERVNIAGSRTGLTSQSSVSFAGLIGNLQGKYSGSVTININLNGHSISEFSVLPTGCWITYYDSSTIKIQFNDVNEFGVFIGSASLTDATTVVTINSLTNWDMHMITYGDNYMQQHIYDSVNTLQTYVDNLESLITTNNNTLSRCQTLLQTIANNGGGSGGSSTTVNNIDVNVDHIADELSLLKTSNDSILDELLGFFTDGLGQLLTIENVIDAISDCTTALTGVQTQLTSIGTQLNSINTTLTSINTSVSNIDNTIDTITWNSISQNTIGGSTTYNGTYTLSSFTSTNVIYIKIGITPIQLPNNRIYRINIPYMLNGTLTVQPKYTNNTNMQAKTIVFPGRLYTTIYLYDITAWTNVSEMLLEVRRKDGSNFTGNYYSSTNNISYIDSSDIEYWTLLTYFNQYDYNIQILDAIRSMSIQVTSQDITNTNNNITNYNTTMNTVEGIETNFINNLNTDLSNLNLTTQYVNPVDTNVRTAFDIVVKDIILDNNNFAGPFFLILICSVVLIFLGRF